MTSTNTDMIVSHETLVVFAASRVNLPKGEVDGHRAQVQRLRDHLQRLIDEHDHYELIKTLHSGSVAKGTALKSVSDMDVAAYLDATQVPAGDRAKLIAELATILRSAYEGTKKPEDFEEQAHSVKVHFHGSGLDVDVSPVVYEGDSEDRGYLITKNGDKVLTSIKLHLEFIRRRKRSHGQDYPQVVRFLKYWAREQKRVRGESFRCKSFLLELVVAHVAQSGASLGDYPSALESVLAWIVRTELRELVWFEDYYTKQALPRSSIEPIRVYDPVNPDNNVCRSYTNADREALVDAAADALDAITAARYATTKEYAVEQWQRVFGPTFRGGAS